MLTSQRIQVFIVPYFYLYGRVDSKNTGITRLTYKISGGGRPVRVVYLRRLPAQDWAIVRSVTTANYLKNN